MALLVAFAMMAVIVTRQICKQAIAVHASIADLFCLPAALTSCG